MLQPILVRAVGDRYQLIAGERRLRASIEAQLHEIPARVHGPRRPARLRAGDGREPPARGPQRASRRRPPSATTSSRYGGTQEELAGRLGLDRSTVSNLIRLLDLPEEVQDAVRDEEDHPGPRPRPARPARRRQPARRLPAGDRREPLGPPDRGPRRHRRARPRTPALRKDPAETRLDPRGRQGPPRPRARSSTSTRGSAPRPDPGRRRPTAARSSSTTTPRKSSTASPASSAADRPAARGRSCKRFPSRPGRRMRRLPFSIPVLRDIVDRPEVGERGSDTASQMWQDLETSQLSSHF